MNQNINEKDTENFVMPEMKTMTEAEQTAQRKTDEKHVSGMNPLKKFAIGAAMAVGLTLGTATMTQAQHAEPTRIGTVNINWDKKQNLYSPSSRTIMTLYNRELNKLLMSTRLSYAESRLQMTEVLAYARLDIVRQIDLNGQGKKNLLNVINQMQVIAKEQLNAKYSGLSRIIPTQRRVMPEYRER